MPSPHGNGTAARSTCQLLVAVDDPSARQVVRRQLHDDPVIRKDTDVVHPHLAADVREDLVTVLQLYLEHGVRQRLDHGALDFDGALLFGHVLLSGSATLIGSRHAGRHATADVSVYDTAPGNTNPVCMPRPQDR